jgi:hypothetical protein
MLTLCLPAAGIHDEDAVAMFGVGEVIVVIVVGREGKRTKTTRSGGPRSSARSSLFGGFSHLVSVLLAIF